MKFLPLSAVLAAGLAAAATTADSSAQIVVTETLAVNGSSFSHTGPGRIVERRYTGAWSLDWTVDGTIFAGDASVLYTFLITGQVGGGNRNFGASSIFQGGPIPVFGMAETFQNVAIGTPVGRTGSLQGTVQDFVGNATDSLLSVETWQIVAAQPEFNTFVDGQLDPSNSIGTYTVDGRFDGTVTLDYLVFPHPSTPVCSGGAALEAYGDDGRLTVLRSPNASTSTAAILVEGTGLPGASGGICLGGPRRVPNSLQQTSSTGEYQFRVDPFAYPIGTTSSFQLWYRTGSGSDFSDAIEVLVR